MLVSVLVAALAGLLGWSFLEYMIHRFLGHDPRTRPNPFATEHVRHHIEGGYFAPSWKKALTATVAAAVLAWPATAVAGATIGLSFVAGFVLAYLSYEVLHRREHTHPGSGAYSCWLRRHHFHHHFGDPKSNLGVTSPIWDRVFGTYQKPGVIRVPRKLAMVWLVDPESREARAEHAAHYVLVPERKPVAQMPAP
jgi:sterol desaturase/sphingolipid hydroxylase (fatty acid hydroxylase superfamily)